MNPSSGTPKALPDDVYLPRIAEGELRRRLSSASAVLIRGPKWCGKTTLARRFCASEIDIADPADDFASRQLAELDPATALQGAVPRLVDEWQEVPKLWDGVRFLCDERRSAGQFILTGSATPHDRAQPRHSGAGRIARMDLGTFSLFESRVSSGTISLEGLCEGERPSAVAGRLSLARIAELVLVGGWPTSIGTPLEAALELPRDYLEALAEADMTEIDGRRRDPSRVRALLASLSRNESTLADQSVIAKDAGNLNRKTVGEYLDILRRLYVVQDIPAWSPALTSAVPLRKQAKHHLCDPSLAAAGIGATSERLMRSPRTLGFLFESLVLRDLLVYAGAMRARVYHYRDGKNLEVDAIVERDDGRWMAVEVKLGSSQVDSARKTLLKLRERMERSGVRPPEAMVCVVGFGGIAHAFEDGVVTVPVDCLGP